VADDTPEGKSIVALGQARLGARAVRAPAEAQFVPFTAQTRMSGVDVGGRAIRKGAADAIARYVAALGTAALPPEVKAQVDAVAGKGATPLVVADGARVLGVIALTDVVKHGIKERFAELRRLGITTVMITGDNPLTAAAIAAEAGVDDFLAEATPEAKLAKIREVPGQGPPGGDDRRRHQRRAGAGPGRRRGGDEHRHAGRQGGRQHGRPRLRPDQAARRSSRSASSSWRPAAR
jgi:K+-transporting ATPase ATPase B chain